LLEKYENSRLLQNGRTGTPDLFNETHVMHILHIYEFFSFPKYKT
jgi:hypothetical protein